MNPEVLAYLPLLNPIATLFIVVLGVFFSNRHVDARIGDTNARIGDTNARIDELHRFIDIRGQAVTSELKQAMLELEMRLSKQISELDHRVERLEGQRLVR